MIRDIQGLSDENAVAALSIVAQLWIQAQSGEAEAAMEAARASPSFRLAPAWATKSATPLPESGDFSRHILVSLYNSDDETVKNWTRQAVAKVAGPRHYAIDPVSLAIGGTILIGAILAARVKKAGPLEFYEGVPAELADVIKSAGLGGSA